MISLLFARVINLIIVIVIVNNFCIVMVRIYNFVENKGIFWRAGKIPSPRPTFSPG